MSLPFVYAVPESVRGDALNPAASNALASFDEAASQIGAPGSTAADLPGLEQKLDAAQAFVDGDGSKTKHYFRVRNVHAKFGALPAGATRIQLPGVFVVPSFVDYTTDAGTFNPLGGMDVYGDAAYLEIGPTDVERLSGVDSFEVVYTTALDADPVLKEIVLRLTAAWWASRGDESLSVFFNEASKRALIDLTAFMDARRDSV